MNLVEIPGMGAINVCAHTHTHTPSICAVWGFWSAFLFFNWQCKELKRSFCSFQNPPDNVSIWILA